MQPFANEADLLDYLGDVPAGADRMLKRASELIDYATLRRYDLGNPDHVEALKRATCQQVEFWLEVGEGLDVAGVGGQMSVDGLSYTLPGRLAPRAYQTLFMAGLLSRGVSMR